MTENRETSLDGEPLESIIESPPAAAPVVVIQYRSRGLPAYIAVPLLLLVALGSVAVYHRISSRSLRNRSVAPPSGHPSPAPVIPEIPTPLALNSQPIAPSGPSPASPSRSPAVAPMPTPAPAAGEVAEAPKSTPPASVEKARLPAVPLPLDPVPRIPAPPAQSTPPPPPEPVGLAATPSPAVPARDADSKPPTRTHRGAVPVGFSVPTDPDQPFSDLAVSRTPLSLPSPLGHLAPDEPVASKPLPQSDQPLPDRSGLMDEIAKEAAQKKEEIQQQLDQKTRARDVLDAESLRRVEEERVAFRRELAEILRTGGKQTGQQIDQLCDRYGRNYGDAIRGRVTYLLRHSTGRVSKDARVRQFRAFGVPEAGILDYLANELHHLINSRNGPRHPDDVRISAARQLLSVKLTREQTGGNERLQARSGAGGTTDVPGNR